MSALFSQVDHKDMVTIHVPFAIEVVRNLLICLSTDDECDEIESEGFIAAREMGIMFLKEKVANTDKKEKDYISLEKKHKC